MGLTDGRPATSPTSQASPTLQTGKNNPVASPPEHSAGHTSLDLSPSRSSPQITSFRGRLILHPQTVRVHSPEPDPLRADIPDDLATNTTEPMNMADSEEPTQCIELLSRTTLASDAFITLPEVLILDAKHSPQVTNELVHEKGVLFAKKLNVPKPVSVVALATYAVSIGFVDPSQPSFAVWEGDYAPFFGTAAAIDDHHLLTCAHLFDYDPVVRKADPQNLQYRIHVRHDHRGLVDRQRMHSHPDPRLDYQVDIVAYGDRHPVSKIRLASNTGMVELGDDIALLYSRKSLNLKSYPHPTIYHLPPNDKPESMTTQDVGLLCYNGLPTMSHLEEHYPQSPRKALYEAVGDIWIDRLSYGKGKTAMKYDDDGIYHRISCYAGASGGWVIDAAGKPIGLHSRGEYRHPDNDPDQTKWIVNNECNNIAVAFDSPRVARFLATQVAPRLEQSVRARWSGL